MAEIRSIQADARRKEQIILLLSDGRQLKLPASFLVDFGLQKGMALEESTVMQLQKAAAENAARMRAVRIMTAGSVSRKELGRRLVQKGESPENAENAVMWLEDLGLIDDEKTAEGIVRRSAAKGYGPARIRQELRMKGIPEEYWSSALAGLPDSTDAIDSFLEKKLRGLMPDQKEERRAAEALLRRGHSWEEIRAGLNRYRERYTEE